jgi:hypothetical protein
MTAQSGVNRRRGAPLAALVLLIAGWTGARAFLWHSPFPSPFVKAVAASAEGAAVNGPPALAVQDREFQFRSTAPGREGASLRSPMFLPTVHPVLPDGHRQPGVELDPRGSLAVLEDVISGPPVSEAGRFVAEPTIAPPLRNDRRFHVAGWVAWRAGSGLPRRADGERPVSYGGTQAGGVVRYDLATDGHRPALYLRATYAPDRPSQAEVAAGAGLRPIANVPLRLMAEMRATRSQDQTEVRPGIIAVTEFAPIALPLGLTAEGYGQAGWVGGDYATAFADGQARVTRAVASAGPVRIHVGAGAWGGAQKFVERLDVGPTIGADIDAGPLVARLALDYRVQVAGNASPGDGVALTLSTGF